MDTELSLEATLLKLINSNPLVAIGFGIGAAFWLAGRIDLPDGDDNDNPLRLNGDEMELLRTFLAISNHSSRENDLQQRVNQLESIIEELKETIEGLKHENTEKQIKT